MAEKRMFTQKIVESDDFLDMPLSAQALYFHLNMKADDDGFINNPKSITRMLGASADDLKLLIAKRFLLSLDGCVVVKHWRLHNTLKKDRYKPTQYQEQFAQIIVKPNKAYTEKPAELLMVPNCFQNGTETEPNRNHRIDKDSIDKNRIEEEREEKNSTSQQIADLFNSLCPSFPPIKYLSESTKTNIQETLNFFNLEEFKTLFIKAEASSFLKGENQRNWVASFDWLIQAENMPKVLNGNYDNQKPKTRNSSLDYSLIEQIINSDFENEEKEPPKTAADDENIRARAEALKQQFNN